MARKESYYKVELKKPDAVEQYVSDIPRVNEAVVASNMLSSRHRVIK